MEERPQYRYPRLIRFVPHLIGRTIATLDREQNLLIVDRQKFERLDEHDQKHLLFTDAREIVLEE